MRRFADASSLSQTSVVFTSDGRVFGSVSEENRICISLQDVAEPVIRTLVAVEDRRFYSHRGIDGKAILRAACANVRNLRLMQGGSTISQQLARIVVLRRNDRTFRRKLLEAIVAIYIERHYSKKEILERYLNAAYFGHNIYGIELAALSYFGKPARDLDRVEAAYLIALLKAPARYCYCCNPKNAFQRTALVLRLVGPDAHFVSRKSSSGNWKRRPTCADWLPLTGQHILHLTRGWLKRSLPAHYPTHRLLVHTTIDLRCQIALETACRVVLRSGYTGRAACIVQDAHSGAVRALAGGIDSRFQSFNAATDGCLQPGSLLKPFILLAAIQSGLPLDQKYISRPLTIRLKDGKTWTIRNAGERYWGSITLADALVVSDNTVYAQLALDLGIERIRDLLVKVGIPAQNLTPAVSTGGIRPGISPLQISGAYSIFSSGGTFHPAAVVKEVSVDNGNLVPLCGASSVRVCSRPEASAVTDILKRAFREGTAILPRHRADLAAKTGTSISGGWYASFNDVYRVLTWTESDFQPYGTSYHFPSKGVSAKILADRIWGLLSRPALGFGELFSSFSGAQSLSVRDLLWVEEQFQKP